VTAKEGACLRITPQLHLPQLLPAPVGVKVGGADECQMDAQGPVNPTAVNTDEDTIGDGGPGGVLGATIITYLVGRNCPQSFEYLHYVTFSGTCCHREG